MKIGEFSIRYVSIDGEHDKEVVNLKHDALHLYSVREYDRFEGSAGSCIAVQ